jgi:hypothetical protein
MLKKKIQEQHRKGKSFLVRWEFCEMFQRRRITRFKESKIWSHGNAALVGLPYRKREGNVVQLILGGNEGNGTVSYLCLCFLLVCCLCLCGVRILMLVIAFEHLWAQGELLKMQSLHKNLYKEILHFSFCTEMLNVSDKNCV